jgi:tight adherence protein C
MVLLISVLMFVFVTSLLYFLGMKLWASPQNVVERVLGEARQAESRHPSLAFREALSKIGNLVPASPADLSLTEKRLYAAGYRTPGALKIFLGIKALLMAALPLAMWGVSSQAGVGQDHLALLCVLAAGLGYMGPNEVLSMAVKRRKKRIQKALPNGWTCWWCASSPGWVWIRRSCRSPASCNTASRTCPTSSPSATWRCATARAAPTLCAIWASAPASTT